MPSDRQGALSRSVRMRDVAKKAGVGTMTVSRVLNGNTKVSADNKQRVLAAIQALHYVPNHVARSLRQQRSQQIGVVVPDIRDPFFAACFDAVGTVAATHDYSVLLATSAEDPEREFKEASRLLPRVDGLIVTPAARGRSRLTEEIFRNFPIVAIDRPLKESSITSVLVRNQEGGYLGTRHLIEHGHSRIAALSLSQDLYTMHSRVNGYTEAMQEAGLKSEAYTVGLTQADMHGIVKRLTDRKKPPTAFFCCNNVLSCNAMHALTGLNVAIPDAVALLGFDDFETADILQPSLTVVTQPTEEIGRTAAELLFARLHDASENAAKPVRKVLPVELIVRNSCGCL